MRLSTSWGNQAKEIVHKEISFLISMLYDRFLVSDCTDKIAPLKMLELVELFRNEFKLVRDHRTAQT